MTSNDGNGDAAAIVADGVEHGDGDGDGDGERTRHRLALAEPISILLLLLLTRRISYLRDGWR